MKKKKTELERIFAAVSDWAQGDTDNRNIVFAAYDEATKQSSVAIGGKDANITYALVVAMLNDTQLQENLENALMIMDELDKKGVHTAEDLKIIQL